MASVERPPSAASNFDFRAVSPETSRSYSRSGSQEPQRSLSRPGSATLSTPADYKADALFRTHTVADVKNIERQTRNDIEAKKAELRQMVGERYRDLIEAADTIMEMGQSAQAIVGNFKRLQDQCSRVDEFTAAEVHTADVAEPNPHTLSLLSRRARDGLDTQAQRKLFYAVSTCMKLLVDTPEHMWSALEGKQYLKAAQLYLLAKHISTQLRMNKLVAATLFTSFPILATQWTAIAAFKLDILGACRAQLRHCHAPARHIADALAGMILLDHKTPAQCLEELLNARLDALKKLGQADENTASGHVCRLVDLVRLTVLHVHAIFLSSSADILLQKLIERNTTLAAAVAHKSPLNEGDLKDEDDYFKGVATQTHPAEESDISDSTLSQLYGFNSNTLTLLRHLPPALQNFRAPADPTAREPVAEAAVRDRCMHWLQACAEESKTIASQHLEGLVTLRDLAACRDAVWALLNPGEQSEAGGDHLSPWSDVSQAVLGSNVCLWTKLLRDAYLHHIRRIVNHEFKPIPYSVTAKVMEIIKKLHGDQGTRDSNFGRHARLRFVWNEVDNDLEALFPADAAGAEAVVPPTARPGSAVVGRSFSSLNMTATKPHTMTQLTLKSVGLTPDAFAIVSELDARLADILADAKSSVPQMVSRPMPAVSRQASSVGGSALSLYRQLSEKGEAEPGSVEKIADQVAVQEAIHAACLQSVKQMVRELEEIISDLNVSVFEADDNRKHNADAIMFVARLCRGIAAMSVQLQECMRLPVRSEISGSSARKLYYSSRSRKGEGADKPEFDERLGTCVALLKEAADRAADRWHEWLRQTTVARMNATVTREFYSNCHAFAWEEVTIQEETEAGSKSTLSVHLPGQCSPRLVNILFEACDAITRAQGYAREGPQLQRLCAHLGDDMVALFEPLSRDPAIDQQGALQMFVDFAVTAAFLSANRGAGLGNVEFANRVQAVDAAIQEKIDPFDLDVFMPHLTANIQRGTSRLATLLGVLDGGHVYSMNQQRARTKGAHATGKASAELAKLLALAPQAPRFTLLPVPQQAPGHRNRLAAMATMPGGLGVALSPGGSPKLGVGSPKGSPRKQGGHSRGLSWTQTTGVQEQASKWAEKVGLSGTESLKYLLWGSNSTDE